jgi:hypothetical protein
MRISILASSCPEYCELRSRSRSLALVWQAGRAALLMSPLFVFGAGVLIASVCIDPELEQDHRVWPAVAALFIWAAFLVGLGIYLRRFAIRKGQSVIER